MSRLNNEVTEQKDAKRHKDANRVGKVVHAGDPKRDLNAHIAQEAGEPNCHSDNICDVGTDVPPFSEVVRARFVAGVQVRNDQRATRDDIVVANKNAGDGREEDLVRAQELDEDRCRAKQNQGLMRTDTTWQINIPRRMEIYLGTSAAMSFPAMRGLFNII